MLLLECVPRLRRHNRLQVLDALAQVGVLFEGGFQLPGQRSDGFVRRFQLDAPLSVAPEEQGEQNARDGGGQTENHPSEHGEKRQTFMRRASCSTRSASDGSSGASSRMRA